MGTVFNNFAQTCESLLKRAGRSDTTLVAGVSGGLDSMVLLDLLARFAEERRLGLVVAHIHHGLRPEADQDALFVEEQAVKRGLRFQLARVPVREHATTHGVSLEMAGRTLRHQALAAIAAGAGTRTLLLAHHADDQIETLLLRLIRGASPSSWGGMRPFGPSPADPGLTVLRPLLGLLRADLATYSAENRVAFREDGSNLDLAIPRNMIRHRVVPALDAARKGAEWKPALLRAMETAREESALLDGLVSAAVEEPGGKGFKFTAMEPALQRRWIARELWRAGLTPDAQLIEHLCRVPEVWVQANGTTLVSIAPDGAIRTRGVPQDGSLTPAVAPTEIHLAGNASRGSVRWGGISVDWQLGPEPLAWNTGTRIRTAWRRLTRTLSAPGSSCVRGRLGIVTSRWAHLEVRSSRTCL